MEQRATLSRLTQHAVIDEETTAAKEVQKNLEVNWEEQKGGKTPKYEEGGKDAAELPTQYRDTWTLSQQSGQTSEPTMVKGFKH